MLTAKTSHFSSKRSMKFLICCFHTSAGNSYFGSDVFSPADVCKLDLEVVKFKPPLRHKQVILPRRCVNLQICYFDTEELVKLNFLSRQK